MNRTLRGILARRGTLLPLLLLTAVVVAGVVAVIALAESSRTSSAVVVPLLLLALVAVPDTGRQLADARRGDITVGRLRGVTGGRLYALLSVEPLLVLTAGSVLGLGVGAVTAGIASRVWFGGPAPVGATVLPAVVMVVVVGLAAVLVGMGGRLRLPLHDQLSRTERPRPASTLALFLIALMLMAAVVATYRATVVQADDPGWVVLAAPALVGLSVGQVAVWQVRLGAALAVRRTAASGLPTFLAVRRLARLARVADPIRLLVAAAVVAAVSVAAALQVTDWTDDTARMRATAPYRVTVDGGVTDALALAAELDPEGRWLMAAAVVPGEGSVPARRGFVDTSRYAAVVGGFLDGTPAEAVSRHLETLGAGEPFVGTGETVTATAQGLSRRSSGRLRPRVTLTYRNDKGESTAVLLRLRVGLDGRATTSDRVLPDCRGGCVATRLTLDRTAGDADLPWVLSGLDVGGLDALDREWQPVPRPLPAGVVAAEVTTVDAGLLVPPADRPLEALAAGGGAAVPILATDSASWDGPSLLDSPGGDERPAKVVGRLPALPLVEADGVLADLATAAAGAPPTVPAAVVLVLAAADTPPTLLEKLGERTGSTVTDMAEVEDLTTAEVGGAQALMYAVIAGFCLLLALLVLASATGRQRAEHRQHAAALRVVGVDPAVLRGSNRRELGVLALSVVGATAVGSAIGMVLLLANLELVTLPPHAVPLQVGLALGPLVGAALGAALVLLVGGRSRAVRSEESRPAILREAER